MIKVENLRHDYEGKGKYAVDGVSFEVGQGRIFGFLGPSGAGKSTVQNILTGLLPLQEGEASLAGVPVRKLTPKSFNRIGYSFEHPNLYGKLTAWENLSFYASLFDVPTLDPLALLERVGLAASAHKRVSQYSKGMKQRLLFVRSIMHRPDILFLDEPESGLDPATATVIKGMIREERDRGAAILLTTHNMYAADELCDRVAFMHEGKILAEGSPRELKLRYGKRTVRVELKTGGAAGAAGALEFDPDEPAGAEGLATALRSGRMETIHSSEATLEAIFIRLTGRGLGFAEAPAAEVPAAEIKPEAGR